MANKASTVNYLKPTFLAEKEHRPLWTVIIPTYNCAHYLKENLASVIEQDPGHDKMEVIVVDDCSTKDNPKAIVESFGSNRIQFYQQIENIGKVRNYETGLEKSKGELIHILHGDDKVRPGFYEEMERIFTNFPDAKAAFCRTIYIDERSQWKGMTGMIQNAEGIVSNILEKLYVQQEIQGPSLVVKRDVYETIGTFDRRLDCMEDWEMWIRIATNFKVAISNKVLAEYRSHENNTTNLTFLDGSALDTHRLVFNIVDTYIPNKIKSKFSKTRDKKQAEFLILSYISRKSKLNFKQKWEFVKSVLKLYPSFYNVIRLIK